MKESKQSVNGFTLIEILLVVAIIGIIIAASVPNLLRARISANEASAIGSCKSICAAQHDYNNNSSPHTYTGSLPCLSSGNGAGGRSFLNEFVGHGSKSGYIFSMSAGGPDSQGSVWTWSATAWPVAYRGTGVRSFYIDGTGIIRGTDTGGLPVNLEAPSVN